MLNWLRKPKTVTLDIGLSHSRVYNRLAKKVSELENRLNEVEKRFKI